VHQLITRDGDPLSSIPIIISSAIFIPIFILILIYMSMLKVDIPIWLPTQGEASPFALPPPGHVHV
jgi:hypothetical protein